MQVGSSSYPAHSPYTASPTLSEAPAPPSTLTLNGYSFPPAPRTAEGAHPPSPCRTASPARSNTTSDYGTSQHEANFSYQVPSRHPHEHQQHGMPEGFQQPRSMSMAGLLDAAAYDQAVAVEQQQQAAAAAAHRHHQQHQESLEYSALSRTVVGGGQVQRVVAGFSFAEYLPQDEQHHGHHHHHPQHPAHWPPPTFPQYRPYAFAAGHLGAPMPPASGNSYARHHSYAAGPPGPPHEWAKPRPDYEDPNAPRHFEPQTPRGPPELPSYPDGTQGGIFYQVPYPGPGMMARSTSNESGLSSFSESAESSHQSSGEDYTGPHVHDHHVNPAFVGGFGTPGDSGYYSAGETRTSASDSDLHAVAGLWLEGLPSVGPSPSRRSGKARDSTVRATYGPASPASGSGTVKPRSGPKRRQASTIFHPSPQSMLAPGAIAPSAGALATRKGRSAPFPGTNSPSLPTDAEFAQMPTKRSRGRRPPCTPDLDLDLDEDPNAAPTEAQLRYVGTTKTGKPKKIFLCKVPGCGKCFKRSEHLKRHVRSIHTNEKPFQCQWPTCGKFFSRHDNLNQHLRIHREPGVTDAEFSAALEECFGPRLEEVRREKGVGQSPSNYDLSLESEDEKTQREQDELEDDGASEY
ncbi:hypothetical protein JCM1841_000304 [Sporobolomyces salmonicolor]